MDNQTAPTNQPASAPNPAPAPQELYSELSDKEVLDQMLTICRLVDANRSSLLGPQPAGQPVEPLPTATPPEAA